ncbi:MAG: hypothetical protein HDR22_08870 [Lachnospiraceae bacterium]|nr:hypothetical protein [Lachnospiraceae bacterium]
MEEGYVIRQAAIHDLERIADLENLCFPEKEAGSFEPALIFYKFFVTFPYFHLYY